MARAPLTRAEARKRKLASMQSEPISSLSEITEYLNRLRKDGEVGAKAAADLEALIVRLFTSDDGINFLIFLEKSVMLSGLANGASDGALRERNAVRNFVTDLRRIAANA